MKERRKEEEGKKASQKRKTCNKNSDHISIARVMESTEHSARHLTSSKREACFSTTVLRKKGNRLAESRGDEEEGSVAVVEKEGAEPLVDEWRTEVVTAGLDAAR